MIMQARKLPRLNDGFYDRDQSHPRQDEKYSASKYHHYKDKTSSDPQSTNSRYSGRGADNHSGHDETQGLPGRTSPRYQNKPSYTERNKDRLEHKANSVDKHPKRVEKMGKDTRNRAQKVRDHRAEVCKSALRVCGDWSEHISSNGTCYYYNCKTEKSKWQKPKEWDESRVECIADSNKQKDGKNKIGHTKQTHDDKYKHSGRTSASSDHHRGDQQQQHRGEQQHHNSIQGTQFGSAGVSHHPSSRHGQHDPGSRSSIDRHPPKKLNSGASRQSQSRHSLGVTGNTVSSTNSSNNGAGQHGLLSKSSRSHSSVPHKPSLYHTKTWPELDHHDGQAGLSGSVPSYNRSYSGIEPGFSAPDRPKDYNSSIRDNMGGHTGHGVLHGIRDNLGAHSGHDSRLDSASSHLTSMADGSGAKLTRSQHQDSQETEDMDISPGSTPTEESMMEKQISLAASSAPVTMTTGIPAAGLYSDPRTSSASSSSSSMLSLLSNLTSLSGLASVDIPTLANLTSLSNLTATSPGGTVKSPGSLLPQLLQQVTGATRMTSQLPSQGGSHGNQKVLQQAIQVLQKMQDALLVQQKQQQQRQLQQLLVTQLQQLQQQLHQEQQHSRPGDHVSFAPRLGDHVSYPQTHSSSRKHMDADGSQSPYSPPDESDGTPLQSPEYNTNANHGASPHSHHEDGERGRESPTSEHGIKSLRKESPTPSHTSSHNHSSVGTSQLSAAHRKQDTVHLTPSLAVNYDESMIGHVSGLIYDHTERVADELSEEANSIGSHLCSQVSVDLKGARSLVRAGEIISTLHEQRILFIRQQIKELDGSRSHNTFTPSSAAQSVQPAQEEPT